MKSLSLTEYQGLLENSEVLEQDRYGVKVLATNDGLIVKLFRRKRLLSSSSFKPYAERFIQNAQALSKLGIRTVKVADCFYCEPMKRTLVYYQPISGETLRAVLAAPASPIEIMGEFAAFLAKLHNLGIFFRSTHLSNVIVTEGMKDFGLIDIADLKIYSKGLSKKMRLRNFRHLTKYKVDRELIRCFGLENFMKIYLEKSSMPDSAMHEFLMCWEVDS